MENPTQIAGSMKANTSLTYTVPVMETSNNGRTVKETRTVKYDNIDIEEIEREIRQFTDIGMLVEIKLTVKEDKRKKDE